jgi:hypothetical protein
VFDTHFPRAEQHIRPLKRFAITDFAAGPIGVDNVANARRKFAGAYGRIHPGVVLTTSLTRLLWTYSGHSAQADSAKSAWNFFQLFFFK